MTTPTIADEAAHLFKEIVDFDDLVRGREQYDEGLQKRLVEAEVKEFLQEEGLDSYKEICDIIVTLVVYLNKKGELFSGYESIAPYINSIEALYEVLSSTGEVKYPKEIDPYKLYLYLCGHRMEWMLNLTIESNRSKLVQSDWIHTQSDWVCIPDVTIDDHIKKLEEGGRYSGVCLSYLSQDLWVFKDSSGKYLKGPNYKSVYDLIKEKLG